MATTFDPLDIEEQAFKRSSTTDFAEQVAFLLETVGARITTAALGLADARPLYKWRDGQVDHPRSDAVTRLRALYRVVWAISEAYSPTVAAAFLRGSNPQLDDKAPLIVLADGEPSGAAVIAAARAFLEG